MRNLMTTQLMHPSNLCQPNLISVPQTIMDSSRVLVMEAGHVKEFDSPAVLLSNSNSAFYKMAKDAGLVASDQH